MKLITVAAGLASLFPLFLTSAAVAGGDAAKGANVFKRCAICHTIAPGGPNRVGPNLHGLFDRPAGKQTGYSYSAGLAKANFRWDDAKLDKWLARPQGYIAGAKMPINVPNPQDRADVISYLHKAAESP
jgi:cytochrome c